MEENNDLKKQLLRMFHAFHNFCQNNNLQYVALGGTMLGAVRHQGFIPWDDDIDVGMPRSDFEKLSILLRDKRIGDKYILETAESNDSKYCFPYSKLYDTTTTLIEETRHQLIRGIYIDIFPLDGIGNDLEEAKNNYRKIHTLLNRLTLRKLSIKKGRVWYKNVLIKMVQLIPFSNFNEKKICSEINSLCKSRDFSDYRFGGNLVGAWGFKEVMDKAIIGTPRLYKFEDFEIFGAEFYDKYLTQLYGNWRELPPAEKRITHHEYYLNLNKPYIE